MKNQYQNTKRVLDIFKERLEDSENNNDDYDELFLEVFINSLESQIESLENELKEYEFKNKPTLKNE